MTDPIYSDDDVCRMKRNRRLTACVGKAPFESGAMANQVARRRDKSGKSSEPYKCTGCGKYHIGNPRWITVRRR